MSRLSSFGADGEYGPPEVLWEDGDRVYCRTWRDDVDGTRREFMAVVPAVEHPTPDSIRRLTHEYGLKDYLDDAWAVRPVELVRERGQTILVLEYHDAEPLSRLIGPPMEVEQFLSIAVALSAAVGRLHGRGLIHKDIKPANVLVNSTTGEIWLTGFGIASRLPRERPAPTPPEFIAGTLAYMAPEQTGRMNRSIDSRSDLYSLGVTLYEVLTGSLLFTASDPMEWVHCHIARNPVPPSVRLKTVPTSVSAILLKLLSKTAEERYQTAAGAESDLRRCLSEWEGQGHIDDFTPGQDDTSDRLMIPEKLYGRDREIDTLLTAFDRIVAGGRPELVLVSGYSGIGKSAVVNELHKPLVPPRGLFASGKFDQYKRDIPYATLAQAFQSLIRPLLSKSEEELSKWRDTIREAIEPNGLLIVDLVPELKHIIGEQPPVPELPPQDAQGRFQLVFRRFISIFARPEHPLALFLDDLQWLDAATLDLLEDLLTRADLKHLLLIGAYRDNEVSPTHPLMRKLEVIRQAGAILQDIVLTPLDREDLGQLLADSLHSESEQIAPLAQLIHEKTTGNPFFAIQFISTLADEDLLTFDYDHRRWSWNLDRIHAKGYTDNVVDLMVGKLSRLPVETQEALRQFACMGNSAEFDTLQMVYENSIEKMHEHLWEAVRAGLILRTEKSYRFLHDRVQEAAYSLIPKELRAEAHLRIGTLLAEHTPPEKLEDVIFEIVNQLNRGSHLITSVEGRERVAELNLVAGKRAKISTAYASALKYLGAGRALLTDTTWELNYELIFSIEYLIAECELLTADLVESETRLSMLSQRAKNRHDFSVVTRLQLTLYTTLDQSDRGVDVFLEYLRRAGTDWAQHPTREEVLDEYDRIWALVGNRSIEELIDLPLMTNPDVLDMLDLFTEIVTPALFYDENLSSLVVCRMVNLSLEYGNCDGSCFGYVWFGTIAGPRFNNYTGGFRLGQLGYDLVEKRGLTRYQARTYMSFGNLVMPWAKHAATGRELVRRAFDAAYRIGDLTFAAYSWDELITNCLMVGDALADVQTEAENGLEFAKRTRFGLVVEIVGAQLGLIRMLRGLTPVFGHLDDGEFDELASERHLAGNPVLALPEFFYLTRKLQGRFFAGDYVSAVETSLRAQQLLWTSPSQLETADFRFYGALAHAGSWDSASADERPRHFEALTAHHKQLEVWAEHCPANFENRDALVAAEIARIEGRRLDAEELYEKAIDSAHNNGFIHNEAVANELAARFYSTRGLERIAKAYLRDARYCYSRWGADGKVRQLEERYPLLREGRTPASAASIGVQTAQLDVETVVKASQALSSEMVLPSLIEKLVRIAVEHAGAERGLLILIRDGEARIEAEATTAPGGIEVVVRQGQVMQSDLPQSALHYVIRTQESVLLDDASSDHLYSKDEYVRQKRSKSVLCLPIVRQAKLVGALYLENNLTSGAFTPDRVAVLQLLASQAAISLENASLYSDLQLQAGLLQNLPVSAWTLKPDGTPDFVNQVWLEYSGQTLDFIRSHPEAWLTAVHPEDREAASRAFRGAVRSGQGFAIETRSLRAQDGTYRWHLQQAVALRDAEGKVLKFVGTTTDINDQKLAGEALRASEANLRRVIDTIPTLTWCNLPDGPNEFLSKGWHEYTGMSPEEAHGWGWQDTFHPEDLPPLMEKWKKMLTSGEPGEVEARIRRFDGVYRWFMIRAEPFRDQTGAIIRWYGASTDIEDRKRGEEALRESERSFRLILDGIAGLVAIMSATGETEVVNRQALEYFGRTAEQLSGWSTGDAVHPDDLPGVYAAWMYSVETAAVYDVDHRLRRTDGVYRWFHARGLPLCDSEGRVLRWYVLLTDIDDRKQAEEALRDNEQNLVSIINAIPTSAWSTRPDGYVEFLNQRWLDYAGMTAEQAQGWGWGDVIHPEDAQRLVGYWQSCLASGEPADVEARLRRFDGTYRWFLFRANPLSDASGNIVKWYGTNIDIDDQKRAEEALSQALSDLARINRVTTMGELAASLAHEVSQPVSGAMTNANVCLRKLESDQPDLEEVRGAVTRIVRDTQRAADIIGKIRSQFQKSARKQEIVDVSEIIREIVVLLRGEVMRYNISVRTELAADLPPIAGDRGQLQQVAMNLVVNSIEAMKDVEGIREIVIQSQRAENQQIVVSVSDTGVGLSPQLAEKIFDPFFTTKPHGTGMGLRISRSIIESHGGRLWAAPNDGPGASFSFSIPANARSEIGT